MAPPIPTSIVPTAALDVAASPKNIQAFAQLAQVGNLVPHIANQSADLYSDDFWFSAELDATRWNKRYPYQLMVVDADNNYAPDVNWIFTLPIPPESMSISMPFAISTQVTLGGIVEEHNGAPLRTITFSGTTGSVPNRPSAATPTNPLSFLGTGILDQITPIFTGTINALAAFPSTVSPVATNLIGQTTSTPTPDDFGRGTGYYQFGLLKQFMEAYVNLKKRKEGRSKRLVVAIWKDQETYVVTPRSFEMTKTASDPNAAHYTLQFLAWKRVQLNAPGVSSIDPTDTPNFFGTLLDIIQKARSVIVNGHVLIDAFVGDVNTRVYEPLRQISLLAKDATGTGLALADMPKTLLTDVIGTAVSAFSNLTDSVTAVKQAINTSLTSQGTNVSVAPPSTNQAITSSADPINGTFQDVNNSYDTFNKIQLNTLQLNANNRKQINAEIDRVRKLTRKDYELMRNNLQAAMEDFADAIGTGDVIYNESTGRASVAAQKIASPEDFDMLFAMNDAISQINQLTLAGPAVSSKVTSIDYVAGLANASGIAFTVPTAKYAVPFPYGATLEQTSLRYLGDANRWMEIAALNGLRTPYIDEEGFESPLLTNGVGNVVVVADVTNLYVRQGITLHSDNAISIFCRITAIAKAGGQCYVTVDTDTSAFKISAHASLHAYLPDTVNSTMQLFIPSSATVSQEVVTKSIPGVGDFTTILDTGGIDLLITPAGDAAITPDGDWRLAIGLNNLIQRAKIAFSTPRGSLPQHQDFGLGLTAGASLADIDPQQLLTVTQDLFRSDPDYTGVYAAKITQIGPVANISLSIGVTGQDVLLPISVDVIR